MGVDGISIQFPGKDKKENFTFIVEASGADQICETKYSFGAALCCRYYGLPQRAQRTQQTQGDETDLSHQKRQLEMHC
jgi:hypothetical protein